MPQPTAVVPSILEPDGATTVRRIRALSPVFGEVEIRGDLLAPDELVRAVAVAGRDVVVAIRRRQDGGLFRGSEEERRRMLAASLEAGAARIDLELDCHDEAAQRIGRDRLILSWHGGPGEQATLEEILGRMLALGAGPCKLVPRAGALPGVREVHRFLDRHGGGGQVTCFASGRYGALSRILAPSWGSARTYGFPLGGEPTAPGQFPAEVLEQVYDVTAIGSDTKIYGLLGRELGVSPSPAMHNAALRALGLDARYLPMEIDTFGDLEFLASPDGPVRGRGFGVTVPYKVAAAGLAHRLDRWSRASGASNTLVLSGGTWQGYNTDGPAILELIGSSMPLRGRSVLVYGAGGTGRTAAAVLRAAGARVTLAGRNRDRVARVASEIGVDAAPEGQGRPQPDILVNGTPLGSAGEAWSGELPFPTRLVLDAPYGSRETDLVVRARKAGLETFSGRDLVLAQAVEQFRLLAGQPPARPVMARAMADWFAGYSP